MQLFKEAQPNAMVLSETECAGECNRCGAALLVVVIHSLTQHEQSELIDNSRMSIAKEYEAIIDANAL